MLSPTLDAVRRSWGLRRFRPCAILLGMTKLTELDPWADPKYVDPWADAMDPTVTYGITCCRCGHRWLPRVRQPVYCPRCRSKHWATPRENRQGLRPGTHAYSLTAAEYIEAGSGGPWNENRVEEMVAKKVAAAK